MKKEKKENNKKQKQSKPRNSRRQWARIEALELAVELRNLLKALLASMMPRYTSLPSSHTLPASLSPSLFLYLSQSLMKKKGAKATTSCFK